MQFKMNKLVPILVMFLIASLIAAPSAWAYSYGDPNKETIAEAYVDMSAKLKQNPPNWKSVKDIYLVHKGELELEFGSQKTKALEQNIQDQDAKAFEANYQSILVSNIERRFKSIRSTGDDYAKQKLLLAKALGTFDVLEPYVGSSKVTSSVRTAFDEALEALGNPGLFGVGKVEKDEQKLNESMDLISSKLKPLFPFTVPVAKPKEPTPPPVEKEKPKPEPEQEKPTPAKPDPPAKTDTSSSDTSKQSDKNDQPANPTATSPDSDTDADASDEEPTDLASDAEGESTEDGEAGDTASEEPVVDGDEGTAAQEDEELETESVEDELEEVETTASVADASEVGETENAFADAPLENNKINPVVTATVIGSVVLIGGIVVFLGLRKGWFKF
ncbi:hypothetical protein [Marinicrinis sediminis]|uniref:Uncharacterized protein n=1 Tax=Marinicrinis sediminis TaxID=1652465 RepID=A0ABW5RAR8_9BACL